jgi:hypothetical protein
MLCVLECFVLNPVGRLLFSGFRLIGFILRKIQVKSEYSLYVMEIIFAEQSDGSDEIFLPSSES